MKGEWQRRDRAALKRRDDLLDAVRAAGGTASVDVEAEAQEAERRVAQHRADLAAEQQRVDAVLATIDPQLAHELCSDADSARAEQKRVALATLVARQNR